MGRDMTVPLTPEEIEGLRQLIRSLPTFDGTSIKSSDYAELFQKMQYERSPEQVAEYKGFWDRNYDGKISENELIENVVSMSDPPKFFLTLARCADPNKSGTIDAEELRQILQLIKIHEPSFKGAGTSFDEFLASADSNKDGRVSIEEMGKWLLTQF